MSRGIPQGYAIDSFAEEGIVFEGASTPLDVTAIAVPWVGARFMELMEAYRNVATFGFMVKDTSRGTVRPGPRGMPLITYNLNEEDTRKMKRAIAILCEVYLAAGAKRVLPFLAGMDEVRTKEDVARLRGRTVSASPDRGDRVPPARDVPHRRRPRNERSRAGSRGKRGRAPVRRGRKRGSDGAGGEPSDDDHGDGAEGRRDHRRAPRVIKTVAPRSHARDGKSRPL